MICRVQQASPIPHALREDAILIAIRRDGEVFYRSDLIHVDSLPARIRQSVKGGSEPTIYIQADMRSRYRVVKDVLDAVHSAQVGKVVFVVYQTKAPSPK